MPIVNDNYKNWALRQQYELILKRQKGRATVIIT